MTVRGHYSCITEHPNRHEYSAKNEHGTTSPTVHEEQRRNGHAYVDHILNGTGNEVDIARETSHAENICNIIHHDVHSRKLRPYLSKYADVQAVEHAWLEELFDRHIGVLALELDHLPDLI